jgi:hypothetical protein
MTSKKQKKGKTMALADFLNPDTKLVTVRATNWSEIVDNEEEETKPIGKNSIKLNEIYIFFFVF